MVYYEIIVNNVICDLAERNASIEEIEKSLTWIFPEQKQSLKMTLINGEWN